MNLSINDAIVGGQGKVAGIFPVDLGRVLLSATPADWEVIRWLNAPPSAQFVSDLHKIGEDIIFSK